MTSLVPAGFGSLAPTFNVQEAGDDLSAGIASGFAVMSYRGGKWRVKHRGEERLLTRPDGDPMTSIELVIIRSATHVAKIFYKDGYKEGSAEAPDCFSNNGLTADQSSRNKQANTCAACPQNAWGSRITPAGKPGKACSDSKRVVVVPLNDISNEVFSGPMLLRVPAASLNELASYGTRMKALGFPYYAIGTRISFDPAANYPKFVFKEIRALTADEANQIMTLRNDARTLRILSEANEHADAPLAIEVKPNFDVPHDPVTGEVKAEPATPQKKEYKKKAAAPAPAPVIEVEAEDTPTGTSFDDELDAQMDALLGAH